MSAYFIFVRPAAAYAYRGAFTLQNYKNTPISPTFFRDYGFRGLHRWREFHDSPRYKTEKNEDEIKCKQIKGLARCCFSVS